jgi:hypothetical protein
LGHQIQTYSCIAATLAARSKTNGTSKGGDRL